MRRLTFAEFFALPEGVLFSQDFALPHRDNGLWRKGKSWEADDEDEAGVTIDDAVIPGGEAKSSDFVTEGSLEKDHRFLVFEDDDLNRLGLLIWDARRVS